jgi:DNA-binding NarL/FixJ family response regulator
MVPAGRVSDGSTVLDHGRRANPLSPREQQITSLLADGLTGRQIACELYLSPETVRTHVRNAMVHVGARTRVHLVAIALREDLILHDRDRRTWP